MRRTTGRVFRHHGSWWVDYSVSGQRFRHVLKDRDGNPVKNKDAALAELDRLTRPYTAATEADRRQLAADALRTSLEVARVADAAARPVTRIADAWKRFPYVRSHRGPVERELSATTIRDNEQLWTRFTRWAEVAKVVNLEDVTGAHADAYRESMIAEGLSGHRVNIAGMAARVIFDLAGIAPNPFAGWKRRANATKGRRELTMEELTKVCQTATGELRALLAVGLYTGMRLGDACTLAWEDVALDLSAITRMPGKTAYKGERLDIPVHPALRAILAELPRGAGPVMPDMAARYAKNPGSVVKILRKHFETAGITTTEEKAGPGRKRRASLAGFHSLRHCFVSLQARAGTPESITRALVGHASPMVHAIYQHANGTDKTRAIAALPAFGKTVNPKETRDREQLAALAHSQPIAAVRKALAALKGGGKRA